MYDSITLRRFSEEEYHEFFRHYEPDPVMDPHPFIYNKETVSRSYLYNHQYRQDYLHYGIFLDNYPVGSFQLKRINKDNGSCEFGIILQSDRFKNKGIGTEAIRTGIRIAKDELKLKRMMGDTSGRNIRMQKVFQKLGFRLIETVHGAFDFGDGNKDDRLLYVKDLV